MTPRPVCVRDLVGVPEVTREQAEQNRAMGIHPMRHRRARAGLVPFDAKGLWAAIKRGEFPAPLMGPEGPTWTLDAVYRWRRHNVKP